MIVAASSGLRREENGLSQCRRASLSSFTANCSRSDSFDQASQLRQAASKCRLVNLREENGVVQHRRASQRREWIVAASSSFAKKRMDRRSIVALRKEENGSSQHRRASLSGGSFG
ncbi:hypothetical protein MRB53_016840 [Persea americana]|uniref:Uncharacterized protein n=1 Tax=Persea americana TaxID=3435 RepID=A0ACC2M482_PERAE|nr:hypothetical protein MRB53_016840 [Persea americana]